MKFGKFWTIFFVCLSLAIGLEKAGGEKPQNIKEEEMIELLTKLNSPERRAKAEEATRKELWQKFQKELHRKFDAVVGECRVGNLSAAIMVDVAADEEAAAIATLTYKRNGAAHFMTVYQISRDGLELGKFETEIEIAAQRLHAFCRKSAELDKKGILYTEEQDLFQPSPREEAIAHLFELKLKHLVPEEIRVRWKKLEPNMSSIYCAPFLINKKRMLVVAVRILNSAGQPDQYPLAYYSLDALDSLEDVDSGIRDATQKITIALEKKTYFNQ